MSADLVGREARLFMKPYKGVMHIWVKERGGPFDAAEPAAADTTRPVPGYF